MPQCRSPSQHANRKATPLSVSGGREAATTSWGYHDPLEEAPSLRTSCLAVSVIDQGTDPQPLIEDEWLRTQVNGSVVFNGRKCFSFGPFCAQSSLLDVSLDEIFGDARSGSEGEVHT